MSDDRIKHFGIAFGLLIAGLIWLILGFFAGPSLEAAAFPILRAATVAGSVSRDEHVMCWTI